MVQRRNRHNPPNFRFTPAPVGCESPHPWEPATEGLSKGLGGSRLLGGAGQRHGRRIVNPPPSPGAIPRRGVEWLPVCRHSLHPYIKYIEPRLSIHTNNRPDGVPCGCPAGLSACSGYISATQILPPTCPSHTPRIHAAYPAHTSFMGPSCMRSTQTPPEPPSSAWRAPIHPRQYTHFSIFAAAGAGGRGALHGH